MTRVPAPTLRHRFVTAGTPAPRPLPPDELWIDVGNAADGGVYDHHQGGASCTAALVLSRTTEIRERAAGAVSLTLTTHAAPDLDAVTACWLVRGLAGAGGLPPATVLNRMVGAVGDHDQGREEDGPLDHSLALAAALLLLDARDDAERMALGFALLDRVGRRMAEGDSLGDAVAAEKLGPRIAAEALAYRADRETAACFPITLADRSGAARTCRALAFLDPRCALLKHFARQGHDGALLVSWSRNGDPAEWRHIISVDPDGPLTLSGLGAALENAERRAEAAIGRPLRPGRDPVEPGQGRFGGDMPSPWYDGRGHGHGIVDSPNIPDPLRPRCASLLPPEAVRETMRRFHPLAPKNALP